MSDGPIKFIEFDEEFHRCPNADVAACEFCKLINTFSLISRTFRLRNSTECLKLVENCQYYVRGMRTAVDKLTPHLSKFDFNELVQSNGYRTFVLLAKCGVQKCLYLAEEINDCSRIYSPSSHPILHEKLVDWSRIFRLMLVVIMCLNEFVQGTTNDSLFSSNREALDKLISMSKERVNVVGFQGRLLGFQFCKSVRGPLNVVGCLMAAFSKVFKTNSIFKHTIISPRDCKLVYYWRNPKDRAERIAEMCLGDPLTFFKEFWLVQEKGLVRILSNCVGEPVQSNLEISIPPTKLYVETKSRKQLTILPPFEYVGKRPVMLRLVSHKLRYGSAGSGNVGSSSMEEMSNTLIVHCHGGGFVAQSSNSHLVYLKSWAKSAGAPIVSVDYSLAPEAPYPRALHEAFYAYLWSIQNAHLLGSTAERVIVAGDSAGGLLLTESLMQLFLVYTPQLLEPAISPARLLSLCDPLIPYPALAACLGAYLGKTFDPTLANLPGSFVEGVWEPEIENVENCSRKFMTVTLEELDGVNLPNDDWHLSPLIAPDILLSKFPKTAIVTSNLDPCMDDCVEFAKRLRDAGAPVTLDIINSVPHGFLNFGKISEECYQGIESCARRLKEFLK
ncbi:Hormone-sensitive lipase [Orchesella cincta]|uniref:Hormone-sensitive lipase n=1 Tax=Orchesella cincta TaxID=48709 RepID=A0A1D2NCL4_ORCCI|nr:Hormone-sensitive lipase [Orchesella cincta]